MNLNTLPPLCRRYQHLDGLSKASSDSMCRLQPLAVKLPIWKKSLTFNSLTIKNQTIKPTMAGQRLYEQVHLSIEQLATAKEVLFEEQRQFKGWRNYACRQALPASLFWRG